MKRISFNIFQRLVRQWDQLHPYNAAQTLKISAQVDRNEINQTWHATLDALGLGCVRIDGQTFRHECLNGQAHAHGVEFLAAGTCLDTYLSDQLNLRFAAVDTVPFRPFLLPCDGGFWLGIVYQHWIADSVSIRLVLREWLTRLLGAGASPTSPIRLPSGGYWETFGPHKAHWQLTDGILSSLRWAGRFRRVRRVEGTAFYEFSERFLSRQFPEGFIGRLRVYARAKGVTVNDVFLAAIALVCQKYVPAQRTSRRQDLALGTIVDLRPQVSDNLENVFGLFLGFTSVICRPQHTRTWDVLLESIAGQSALHKKTGVPQASIVRMVAGLVAGRMLSKKQVANFYRRRVPMAGGISNVNLNQTWALELSPHPIEEFIRVSPTGPMMPIVFTTTTLGEKLNFGLTYRRSIVSEDNAGKIADLFIQIICKAVDPMDSAVVSPMLEPI